MPVIREIDAQDGTWRAFCALQEGLSLFQSPQWSQVLERTYGFRIGVAAAFDGERLVGGIPFAQIEDFRGPRRISLTFSDNLEPLPPLLWPNLEAYIAEHPLPWTVRTRCAPALVKAKEVARHHELDLPTVFEDAVKRFHLKHRQNYQQAIRAGLSYRRCGHEGLAPFYDLHTHVRQFKHELLPQGRTFFENICDAFFPDNGFILIAEHDGKPVSAMFFLAVCGTLYYKFSASELEALNVRPNHYLITKAIEIAIAEGYRTLDLGISDAEGLIRFKERVGATSSTVYAAAYNAIEKTSAVAEVERTLGALTNLLTRPDIPQEAVQKGGELLYRFFT